MSYTLHTCCHASFFKGDQTAKAELKTHVWGNELSMRGNASWLHAQFNRHGLPGGNVDAVERVERLQGHTVHPSARRYKKPKHDIIGVHFARVGHIDRVRHERSGICQQL